MYVYMQTYIYAYLSRSFSLSLSLSLSLYTYIYIYMYVYIHILCIIVCQYIITFTYMCASARRLRVWVPEGLTHVGSQFPRVELLGPQGRSQKFSSAMLSLRSPSLRTGRAAPEIATAVPAVAPTKHPAPELLNPRTLKPSLSRIIKA